MNVLVVILIGLIVGLVAKFLIPGDDPVGVVLTTLLGVAGAVLASYLGRSLGLYAAGHGAEFVAAVMGSMILLLSYRIFIKV